MTQTDPRKRSTDLWAGDVVADMYILGERIGVGGMAEVYQAMLSDAPDIRVAVKFLKAEYLNLPGFIRRFERETELCRMLDHPHCVSVLHSGVHRDRPFLVMPFIDGEDLAQIIRKGPLSPKRAIAITRQVLKGLDHAHGLGIVHRDLKPANIMILPSADESVTAQIMDFGAAQLILEGESQSQPKGTTIGTPSYIPPELFEGRELDHVADLYAIGVMLFEMLAGERPYNARDPIATLRMQLKSPIPSLRALKPELNLSAELEQIIVKAMQKQPENRYQSAKRFASDLGRVSDRTVTRHITLQPVSVPVRKPGDDDTTAPRTDPAPATEPTPDIGLEPSPRSSGPIIIVLLALAAIAAGAWFWFR